MDDRLATIDMGRKVGAVVPLSVGELGPYLTQCRRGRGLPPYIKWQLIHPTVWPQCTNVTDRQDRQTGQGSRVAYRANRYF